MASAGTAERFTVLRAAVVRSALSSTALAVDIDSAVDHVMGRFSSLAVHPDVPDGVRTLAATGARLVTLTNGAADLTERLLATVGIRRACRALWGWCRSPMGAYPASMKTRR